MTHAKPKVFISHSSQDKNFVESLAKDFRGLGINVWYDKWEIAVGDSIVDKIFEGLEASDTLVIVLSQVSVSSRWVKEELSTAVMRRISENNIRILPALIESCDIPTPLKHIRYADFRGNREDGLFDLLEAIMPGHLMWQSLAPLYEQLCILCDKLAEGDLDTGAVEITFKINFFLESALNLRVEIESRRARESLKALTFLEQLNLLANKGVDVHSQTWNMFRNYSALEAHAGESKVPLRILAESFQRRYPTKDLGESLKRGMERLKEVMHNICFDQDSLNRSGKNN